MNQVSKLEHVRYFVSLRDIRFSGSLESFTSDESIAAKLGCTMKTEVFRMKYAHNCHVLEELVRKQIYVESTFMRIRTFSARRLNALAAKNMDVAPVLYFALVASL